MPEHLAPVDTEYLRRLNTTLATYKAGKLNLERRVIASENWWKLRNAMEEQTEKREGFRCASGWLHNVLTSKHADAMDAMPSPVILPREAGDQPEAQMLTSVIPCILEQNDFEDTYADVMWQKLKTGTGVYKVMWDPARLGGLGDIAIERVSLLNLFWEPGVTDIQRSPYLYHTELVDREALEARYPQLKGQKAPAFQAARFLYDDTVDTTGKVTLVECYYHRNGLLHYVRYVGETLLYATENDEALQGRGFYDHGRYPFVLDTLFPIEGSPCGYGFVDLCRSPQTEIDLLKTAFLQNAMAGATPRFFARADGAVNEQEFLDLTKAIVHVNGTLGEESLRQIQSGTLDSVYIACMNATIQELRETSGNTETASGNVSGGVTAASAIAALQEASGKGSRDATRGSYRAFCKIVSLCIELIRQFYDLPRQFRILGTLGQPVFVRYDGVNLRQNSPVFDIRVAAQKRNAYATLSQNELALQLYNAGIFDPQRAEQAMQCLQMMEFEGKETVLQQIVRNGGLQEKMQLLGQYAQVLAEKHGDEIAAVQLQEITGVQRKAPARQQAKPPRQEERAEVRRARAASADAPVPES